MGASGDRVAVVTGCSSGLGRFVALELARSGYVVAATARRVDRLAELVEEIETEGGRARAVALDVRDAGAVAGVLDEVEASCGLPQVLVKNAGVPDARRAHRMPLEVVDAVLETNVRAPWLLSTALAGRLIAQGLPGRIVNISSMSAFHYSGEGAALYSTTKAALNRMTETLAVEWAAHGINVNAIAPGAFASEMMDGMLERVGDVTAGFPRGRLGAVEHFASTLRYLLDPASEAVTGTVIKVDDGQTHR